LQFDIPKSRIPDEFGFLIRGRKDDLNRLVAESKWVLPYWWGFGWDNFIMGIYPDLSNLEQKLRITNHYYSYMTDEIYRKHFTHLEGVLEFGEKKIGDGEREQVFTKTQLRVYLMKLSNMSDEEIGKKLDISRRSANDHWNKVKRLTGRVKSDIPPIVSAQTDIEKFRGQRMYDEEISKLSNDRSVDKYVFKKHSECPYDLEIEYEDDDGNLHLPSWSNKYKIDKDLIIEANKLLNNETS